MENIITLLAAAHPGVSDPHSTESRAGRGGCARARLVQAGQALLAGDLAEAVDHAAVLARRAVAAVHLRARAHAQARPQAQIRVWRY